MCPFRVIFCASPLLAEMSLISLALMLCKRMSIARYNFKCLWIGSSYAFGKKTDFLWSMSNELYIDQKAVQ